MDDDYSRKQDIRESGDQGQEIGISGYQGIRGRSLIPRFLVSY